jgi:hypothetical protein
MRHAMLIIGLVFFAGPQCFAEDKEKPALSGKWSKKEGQMQIVFPGKDSVKLYPHGDKLEIAIVCSYTIDKEGLVKAKITDFEGKDEIKEQIKNKYPAGFAFQFTWKTKGDAASLDNVDGKDAEGLKSHLEGEYVKTID